MGGQIVVKSGETDEPVSYATISFKDGYGTFADDSGKFYFSKKLYPKIDSIYVSALGFEEKALDTKNLPKIIVLESKLSELDEVVILGDLGKKVNEETIKPYLDNDYYKSWLPTIESEIAVFFNTEENGLTKKITSVHFPLTLESKNWDKRKRANADKRPFSTLFKVKFYGNDKGQPGNLLTNSTIVFRATEKMGDEFILNVSEENIIIPKNGLFVSVQVLGYTDKNGKLLPNKKFKEIKTNGGIVRIPTNFRPLLPFTDKIKEDRTFIKRVFIQGNKWVPFNRDNVSDSSLLKAGLNNYGMGISFNEYKND